MNVSVWPYDFKDLKLLLHTAGMFAYDLFFPPSRSVIIGRGNKPILSLHEHEIIKNSIPVYRRPSGGEAVLISPETLIIAIVKIHEMKPSFQKSFKLYTHLIIESLTSLGIEKLYQRGISDICIGDKKIFGSSMYYTKNRLLFHGVLNIDEPVENIERYIKHPIREPDYRKNRPHHCFVTSLVGEGYSIPKNTIKLRVDTHLSHLLSKPF